MTGTYRTMNRAILLLLLLLIAGTGVSLVLLYSKRKTSKNELGIMKIAYEQNPSQVVISGTILSSGKSYRGYSYDCRGNRLILTIYSGLVNRFYPNGDFEITISDESLAEIEEIYLDEADSDICIDRRNMNSKVSR